MPTLQTVQERNETLAGWDNLLTADELAEYRNFQFQSEAEIDAENAWLRAAEAGDPGTWEEERIEALTEIYGYGPPPGFHF